MKFSYIHKHNTAPIIFFKSILSPTETNDTDLDGHTSDRANTE